MRTTWIQVLGNVTINLGFIAQKMKFSIKDYFSKCDQICSFLRIWVTFTEKILKGYLRYKTILCYKVAVDAQLMNFLFEEKITFRSREM